MSDKRDKLRILISDSIRIWGGAQRFIVELAAGLVERGHEVHVQTFPGAPLAAKARRVGLTVHEVAVRTDSAPWIVLPLALQMKRRPYDVVMTTWDKDLRTTGLAARLASRFGGRYTLVVHTRECDDPLKNKARYRWFYNGVADRIIVNSRATLNSTLASAPWLDADRTFILYKGIDLNDYRSLDVVTDRYDVVACLEVIEHLLPGDAVALLAAARERLAPGGRLVLSTPNVMNPTAFLTTLDHKTPFAWDELGGVLTLLGYRVRRMVRVQNDPVLRRLGRWLVYPVHRMLGIDFARSIAVVAERNAGG